MFSQYDKSIKFIRRKPCQIKMDKVKCKGWQENRPSQPLQGNFQQIQPPRLPDKRRPISRKSHRTFNFALIIGLWLAAVQLILIGKTQTNKDIQRIKGLSKAPGEAKDKSDSFTTDGQSVSLIGLWKTWDGWGYTNDEGFRVWRLIKSLKLLVWLVQQSMIVIVCYSDGPFCQGQGANMSFNLIKLTRTTIWDKW